MMIDCDHVWIEQRVSIEAFTEPGQFGTLDVGGINVRSRIIRLHDWKYGEGIGVEAEGNWQAIAYVLGLWDNFGWRLLGSSTGVTVEIVIDQPRRPPTDKQRWSTTLDHLLTYVPTMLDAIRRTNDANAPRHAGLEWCFFCKARGSCAELAQFNLEQAALKFEDMDTPPPSIRDLTEEEIAKIVRNAPLWSTWMRGVHESALQSVLQGHLTTYLKAVPGRAGHRYWTNEVAAERALVKSLGKDAYQRKLLSPAMAEKKLGVKAADLAVLWKQRESKPSLVPVTDEREGILPWASAFENLENNDG